MYYNTATRQRTAAEIISFGIETLKSSKLIQEIDVLRNLKTEFDLGNKDISKLGEFAFSYIMDCIRISLFFENYMKAELISQGFCVHKIIGNDEKLKKIIRKQYKSPISLQEIQEIIPFQLNKKEKTIFHPNISEFTIGHSILVKTNYLEYYELDDVIIEFIKEINTTRNKLHFYNNINFNLSDKLLNRVNAIDDFSNHILVNRLGQRNV